MKQVFSRAKKQKPYFRKEGIFVAGNKDHCQPDIHIPGRMVQESLQAREPDVFFRQVIARVQSREIHRRNA
jgi:hypothetical protein